jgi:hypothetical protein
LAEDQRKFASFCKRSMTIRVEHFTGEAGLRALAPAWRSLTAQLKFKRHFHHVEWYLALAEALERHNLVQLRCIAVFSASDALVAVFPFRCMPIQIGPIKLNAMRLASDQLDADTARDFVMSPALTETGFFQGFVRYIAEHDPTWDVIVLPGILEDSLAATAVKHFSQVPCLQTPGGAWGKIEFISCGDNDQPLECLSKGFKQNLRTSHNKFKSNHVTFEVARAENDLVKFLPEFLMVESSGWKGELGTSALKSPATSTFLHNLISHFAPSGRCEIHLMQVDGKTIASLFGIVTDNIWYIFRTAYDEAYHRMSPGHLIIENLLKKDGENKTFHTLTPYNAPPWFHAWKPDKVLKVFNTYVFRPSSQGAEIANRVAMVLRGSG